MAKIGNLLFISSQITGWALVIFPEGATTGLGLGLIAGGFVAKGVFPNLLK